MRWLPVIAFFALFNTHAQHPTFIIDRSQCQPVYPYDAGPSGISYLVDHVVKPNYRFIFFDGSANDNGLLSPDLLKQSIVLVPPTIHKKFDLYNGIAGFYMYEYWLNLGANIVFVAEHDDYYYNATNINAITAKYGLKVNANSITAGPGLQGAWPIGKSGKLKLDSIRFYLPASLQCTNKNATVWATIDTAIVCATVPALKGTITVVADYEMLWNMTATEGIHYGNNRAFFTGLFNQIAKGDTTGLQAENNARYSKLAAEAKALGFELVLHTQVDPAHIKPNQVVVFDRPTENVNWPDSAFKKINKALIIGDANSNYFGMLEKEGGINVLKALGYTADTLPINTIAAHFWLRFSQNITCNGSLNNSQLLIKQGWPNNTKALKPNYTCGGTSKIEKLFLERRLLGYTIYQADTSSMEIYYNGPLGFDSNLGPDSTITLTRSKPMYNGILAYRKRDVFAISGADMYHNLFYAEDAYSYLRLQFKEWLKQE